MADWIIKDTTLKKIADKVRGLNDSSASMLVKNIAENIPEKQDKNVAITENGTKIVKPDNGKILGDVTIETNVAGGGKPEQEKTVNIKANGTQTVKPDTGKTLSEVTVITDVEGGEVVLQEKTINPTTEQQQVRPDAGYGGLSQVTVEAIQTEEKTVMPKKDSFSVIPSSGKFLTEVNVNGVPTEEKTVTENGVVEPSDGKFLSKVTVNVPKGNLQRKRVTLTENNRTSFIYPDPGYDGISEVWATVNVPGVDFTQVTAEAADVLSTKTFYNKNGSLVSGQMPVYNGEYFSGLYPPTVSVADNTLMWSAVEGADGYKVYNQKTATEQELLADITETEYNLLDLSVGVYSLSVVAYTDNFVTPNSNVVEWIKASIAYTLTNVTVKQSPAYFTTNTPATITFEKAFGYLFPNSATVSFATQDSYSNGELRLSSPTKSEVLVSASGVKDTSAQIPAGSYTFVANPTPIQATLKENVKFTYKYQGNVEDFVAIEATASGVIYFEDSAGTDLNAYNGSRWYYMNRTINVTETANVSADFLHWFNDSMEQQLGAPVISLSGSVVSWSAVENATSYDVKNGNLFLANTASTSFDLAPYGKQMGAGAHNITVVAKATGFADSQPSNTKTYTVQSLAGPENVQIQVPDNGENISWTYPSDSPADGAILYVHTDNGTGYEEVRSFTKPDHEWYLGKISEMTAGTHTYSVVLTDSAGKYADSAKDAVGATASFTVYGVQWNLSGVKNPGVNKVVNNGTMTYDIVAETGYALPDTISVLGDVEYTWLPSDEWLRLQNATSDVVVNIRAVKQATVAAGTYYWVATDPPLSSTYMEARFAFKSGSTTYSKLSSGNNEYIKYDDTTVFSVANGSQWSPSTARTIIVETDQYISQTAYNLFFGSSGLKLKLSTPAVKNYDYVAVWNKVNNATEYYVQEQNGSGSPTYSFGTIYDIHNFVEAKAANYNFNDKTISLTEGTYNFKAPFSGNTVRIMFTNGCYFEIFCGAGITLSYYEAYAGSTSTIANGSFNTPISFKFRNGSSDTGEPYVEKFLLGQGSSPSSFTEITPEEFKAGITLNFDL